MAASTAPPPPLPAPIGRVLRPAAVLTLVAALFALYAAVLHPWMMSWGATAQEQRMALPGDEGPGDPARSFTRAITIRAPPSEVWRWVIQIGQDRAGF
jgi:hypothetical protein